MGGVVQVVGLRGLVWGVRLRRLVWGVRLRRLVWGAGEKEGFFGIIYKRGGWGWFDLVGEVFYDLGGENGAIVAKESKFGFGEALKGADLVGEG